MVISTKMTYLMLFTFILALVIQRALSNQTEFRSSSETLSDEVLQKSKGRRLSEGIIESAYGKMNQVSRRTNKNVAVEKVNNGIPQEDFRSTNKKATRTTRGLLQEGNSFHDNGFVSPSNGTDVLTHPIAVIKCANQTLCVRPKLQLQEMYDVYYCKHVGHGVRFYFLVKEGLLLHPNIRMVDDINKAQMIVYLPVSAPWEKSECNDPELKSKTIVLDEGDGPHLFEPHGTPEYKRREWLLYFKRSYVERQNGIFMDYMGYLTHMNVLPMTYTIVEAYVKTAFSLMKDRDLEIVCTLRGSNSDPTRLRVRQWVEEYAKARGVKKYIAGQVNGASRTEVSSGYLTQMFRAKIIVTSNPSHWEGDFRLMEAIASGALILVDRMYVPRPYALIEGVHIVYYDNNNKTDVFEKLDYYRKNVEIARRLAVRGYLHSMKHHRAANLIDYVFRTVHLKMTKAQRKKELEGGTGALTALPLYTNTGYDMRQQAIDMSARFKSSNGSPAR